MDGIVQETIHSIKLKKFLAMVLKLDLEKSYDKVDTSMLHLIMLQIGIPVLFTNWIMSCTFDFFRRADQRVSFGFF